MIVVTHEMNFAQQIADRVIFLEDGHILEQTPSKQFFSAPQTKRAQARIVWISNIEEEKIS